MVNSLYESFIEIFGEYQPIIGTDPSTGNSVDCINFGYIGCVAFALVVCFCVLRIVGTLINDVLR